MSKLSKKHAVTAGLLMRDANWVSPAMKAPDGPGIVSMAQYFNLHGAPPAGTLVQVEVGREWREAVLLGTDTAKDASDPNNYGYWHSSKVFVRIGDSSDPNSFCRWVPFSMTLVKISAE